MAEEAIARGDIILEQGEDEPEVPETKQGDVAFYTQVGVFSRVQYATAATRVPRFRTGRNASSILCDHGSAAHEIRV